VEPGQHGQGELRLTRPDQASTISTARIQALGLALLIHTVRGVGFCLRVCAVKG
jgi:hypothetical protein